MPVELRKRKEPATQPTAAPAAKKQGAVAKAVDKVKEVVAGSTSKTRVQVGDVIALDDFGGEIETNDGVKTTLKQLVHDSKAGVVLFTYPKASTPGCTTQVCLFRDSYQPLTATGFSIYGLSKDSAKANTTFKEKQQLPYPLLCDQSGKLIAAIGMKKAPAGTTRGVFVVDKSGKVLAAEPGGPAATVEVVKKLVASDGASAAVPGAESESKPSVDTAAPESSALPVGDEAKTEASTTITEPLAKIDGKTAL